MRRSIPVWFRRIQSSSSLSVCDRVLHARVGVPNSLALLSSGGAWLTSSRSASSYPTPHRSKTSKARKRYNFLNSERLIYKPKRKLSRKKLRERDDKALQRKNTYREQFLKNVETKIHYFPPVVKQYVFFPVKRNTNKRLLFKGERPLITRTHARVFSHLVSELKLHKHREALQKALAAANVSVSEEEWKMYCDKEGNVNIGLLYSPALEYLFDNIAKKHVEKGEYSTAKFTTMPILSAYLLLYPEEAKSIEEWSAQSGEIVPEELADTTRALFARLKFKFAKKEIDSYGLEYLKEKLRTITFIDQKKIVKNAVGNFDALFEKFRSQRLFRFKILLGIYQFPEALAIQSARRNYILTQQYRHVVDTNGVGYPKLKGSRERWAKLSEEERSPYYCFGSRKETTTLTGGQLYIRFCTRDYGIGRTEATTRFRNLSDAQQAALNFPFYYSIAPPPATKLAFRRFYLEMSHKYGLLRSANATFGNKYFEAAMRKKWLELTPEERYQYDEVDVIQAAFPLQPSRTDSTTTRTTTAAAVPLHEQRNEPMDVETVGEIAKQVEMAERSSTKKNKKRPQRRSQSTEGENFLYGENYQGPHHPKTTSREGRALDTDRRELEKDSPMSHSVSPETVDDILEQIDGTKGKKRHSVVILDV